MSEENITDLLIGEKEIKVSFTNGREDETIIVEVIPFIENQRLAIIGEGEPVQVVLSCTNLSASDLLEMDKASFMKLHKTALELNLPEYNEWVKHLREVKALPAMIAHQKLVSGLNSDSQESAKKS